MNLILGLTVSLMVMHGCDSLRIGHERATPDCGALKTCIDSLDGDCLEATVILTCPEEELITEETVISCLKKAYDAACKQPDELRLMAILKQIKELQNVKEICFQDVPIQSLSKKIGNWRNIYLDLDFKCDSKVIGWHFYAQDVGTMSIGVWRKEAGDKLKLVAKNEVVVTDLGENSYIVPEEDQIQPGVGDVVGITYPKDGKSILAIEEWKLKQGSKNELCCGLTETDMSEIHNDKQFDGGNPVGTVVKVKKSTVAKKLIPLKPIYDSAIQDNSTGGCISTPVSGLFGVIADNDFWMPHPEDNPPQTIEDCVKLAQAEPIYQTAYNINAVSLLTYEGGVMKVCNAEDKQTSLDQDNPLPGIINVVNCEIQPLH